MSKSFLLASAVRFAPADVAGTPVEAVAELPPINPTVLEAYSDLWAANNGGVKWSCGDVAAWQAICSVPDDVANPAGVMAGRMKAIADACAQLASPESGEDESESNGEDTDGDGDTEFRLATAEEIQAWQPAMQAADTMFSDELFCQHMAEYVLAPEKMKQASAQLLLDFCRRHGGIDKVVEIYPRPIARKDEPEGLNNPEHIQIYRADAKGEMKPAYTSWYDGWASRSVLAQDAARQRAQLDILRKSGTNTPAKAPEDLEPTQDQYNMSDSLKEGNFNLNDNRVKNVKLNARKAVTLANAIVEFNDLFPGMQAFIETVPGNDFQLADTTLPIVIIERVVGGKRKPISSSKMTKLKTEEIAKNGGTFNAFQASLVKQRGKGGGKAAKIPQNPPQSLWPDYFSALLLTFSADTPEGAKNRAALLKSLRKGSKDWATNLLRFGRAAMAIDSIWSEVAEDYNNLESQIRRTRHEQAAKLKELHDAKLLEQPK